MFLGGKRTCPRKRTNAPAFSEGSQSFSRTTSVSDASRLLFLTMSHSRKQPESARIVAQSQIDRPGWVGEAELEERLTCRELGRRPRNAEQPLGLAVTKDSTGESLADAPRLPTSSSGWSGVTKRGGVRVAARQSEGEDRFALSTSDDCLTFRPDTCWLKKRPSLAQVPLGVRAFAEYYFLSRPH